MDLPMAKTAEDWRKSIQDYCGICPQSFEGIGCQFDWDCVAGSPDCESCGVPTCSGRTCATPMFARHFVEKYGKMEKTVMNSHDDDEEDDKRKEMVNHPDHYNQGDIECIDALKAMSTPDEYLGFLRLNAVKYLWRAGRKDQLRQDLRKAMWYIERMLKEIDADVCEGRR